MNGLKQNYAFVPMLCCISLLAFTTAQSAAAAPTDDASVSVTATVSKNTVGVADPFTVTIEAIAPASVSVRFPRISEQTTQKVGPFEVTDQHDVFDVPTAQGRKYIRQLTLETLQTGDSTIQPFEISYKGEKSSEWASAKTNPIPITVESAITEADNPAQFRDLKNVVFLDEPTTASATPWATLVLVGLTAGVGLLGLIVLNRFRKRLSFKQMALRSLDEILRSESILRGDTKFVYEETTQVLRTFIESQFEFPATRQTTEEFLASVNSDPRLDNVLQQRLEQFLVSADMVKFAGLAYSPNVLQKAIDSARQFVLQADEQRIAATKNNAGSLPSIAQRNSQRPSQPTHPDKQLGQRFHTQKETV